MPTETAAPVSLDERRIRAADVELDEAAFLDALDDCVSAVEDAGVAYVLMGGIASAASGRPRWTHDIDLFVQPPDARRALDALEAAGFRTEETFPDWLYKAFRDDQLVDVIFRSAGDIYLDDEMLARACLRPFKDRVLRVIPTEDLIVVKAVVHDEHMPRHWHDALGLIAGCPDLDWDYLVHRARKGARRVLSLLLYAQSNDLIVPARVIQSLYDLINGEGA